MPKPHFRTDIALDLRPGGRFDSIMHVDGMAIASTGCVLDAIQDRRFGFTDLMTANFQPAADPGLGFTATIGLSDQNGGMLYHVTARHRTDEDAEKLETMGFSNGWGAVVAQLDAYASTL